MRFESLFIFFSDLNKRDSFNKNQNVHISTKFSENVKIASYEGHDANEVSSRIGANVYRKISTAQDII